VERSIEYLSDDAIYRRTPAGQRELLVAAADLSPFERRFLAVVTGYTSLRVLLDMGRDGPGIGDAIMRLVEHRLIALEPSVGASRRPQGCAEAP
jgi:hypothetical protein